MQIIKTTNDAKLPCKSQYNYSYELKSDRKFSFIGSQNTTVFISSGLKIWLPLNTYAVIYPDNQFAANGIFASSALIVPNKEVGIYVFSPLDSDFEIGSGQTFAHMFILQSLSYGMLEAIVPPTPFSKTLQTTEVTTKTRNPEPNKTDKDISIAYEQKKLIFDTIQTKSLIGNEYKYFELQDICLNNVRLIDIIYYLRDNKGIDLIYSKLEVYVNNKMIDSKKYDSSLKELGINGKSSIVFKHRDDN